ncbi:hypothetical protein tb265_07350 [Gemmatimonadetes bacterium T265]|nr:hypothetical protein tb265_07350 [Gemmatimonadetes bacterium T265]
MTAPQRLYTEEEYLALDAAAPRGVRYEFANGLVTRMTGADPNHEQIVANAIAHLHPITRDGRCRVYPSNLRVTVQSSRAYKYPDVSGLCGCPEFLDTRPRTFLNPSFLIEVLSPSTERGDRTDKFAHYQLIPSLAEYVLVAQHYMRVERYVRSGASWVLDVFTRADEVVELPSVGGVLRLGDVYANVDLPNEPPPTMPRLVREAEAPAWGAAV